MPWCKHLGAYFVPNVAARTNHQVYIDVASFPELGVAGPDTAYLIADGTLDMTEIYGGYVGEEFPALSLQYLWDCGLTIRHTSQRIPASHRN